MGILSILGAVSGLGSLFGKGAQSSAEGRAKEADFLSRQDAIKSNQYNTAQDAQMQLANTDLARKQFSESARGGRGKQAAIADLLMNFKPTQVNVPGITPAQISGGLQLGEGGKAGMAELMKQALAAQLAGDKFEGGNILQAPGVSAIPKASGWEKTMGLLGTLGSIGGGIGAAFPGIGGGGGADQGSYSSAPAIQENLRNIVKRNVEF